MVYNYPNDKKEKSEEENGCSWVYVVVLQLLWTKIKNTLLLNPVITEVIFASMQNFIESSKMSFYVDTTSSREVSWRENCAEKCEVLFENTPHKFFSCTVSKRFFSTTGTPREKETIS